MSVYSYAKSLVEQIEEAVASKNGERESELRAELDRNKDAAVAEAHASLADGDGMTATVLSNGQAVPSTRRTEVEKFLNSVGAAVPARPESQKTDPIAPSIVDPPLAANPANLVAGDGTDPVKTPPVVTQIQENGVATVVAPSAPEWDKSQPAPVVQLDTSQIDGVGSAKEAGDVTAPAEPDAPESESRV